MVADLELLLVSVTETENWPKIRVPRTEFDRLPSWCIMKIQRFVVFNVERWSIFRLPILPRILTFCNRTGIFLLTCMFVWKWILIHRIEWSQNEPVFSVTQFFQKIISVHLMTQLKIFPSGEPRCAVNFIIYFDSNRVNDTCVKFFLSDFDGHGH